jgi:hypothetical protein
MQESTILNAYMRLQIDLAAILQPLKTSFEPPRKSIEQLHPVSQDNRQLIAQLR